VKRKLTHKHKKTRIKAVTILTCIAISFHYKMTIHALYNFLVTVILLVFDYILNVYRESLDTFNIQSNTSNTTVTKKGLKITS